MKAYLAAVAVDGEFEGTNGNPIAVVNRAVAVFSRDIPLVVGDFIGEYASATVRKFGAQAIGVLGEKLEGVARKIGSHGAGKVLGDLWKRVLDAHDRGMKEPR